MPTRYIVIIQCEIAHHRCSGFHCTNAFYNREEMFKDYEKDTQYISFTCGGCCGKGISVKLEHLAKKLDSKKMMGKDQVVIHLASCMTTDNYHYERCPNIGYIKRVIAKKGFQNVVEGSYISKKASQKREEGIYKNY